MYLSKISILPVILLAGLGAGVIAQEQLAGEAAIEARQALMQSNRETLGRAEGATGADAISVGETWVANFQRLPTLFPEDSQEGETRALPVIWENPEGIAAEIAAAQEAAQAVLDAATAGDMTAYAAAVAAMGERCGSCHAQFRAES